MFKKLIVGTVIALSLTMTAANAATLNFVGPKKTFDVSGNDVLPDLNTEINVIRGDQKRTSNGLFLDLEGGGPVEITYTYLGFEAGNTNFAAAAGGGWFLNQGQGATTVGSQITTTQETSGLLAFAFGTVAPRNSFGLFINNALAYPASRHFAMGFSQISSTSFFILFDDIGSGDRDFDDMVMRVDIAAVPLPAGGLLLLSGLFGMAALGRRRQMA